MVDRRHILALLGAMVLCAGNAQGGQTSATLTITVQVLPPPCRITTTVPPAPGDCGAKLAAWSLGPVSSAPVPEPAQAPAASVSIRNTPDGQRVQTLSLTF